MATAIATVGAAVIGSKASKKASKAAAKGQTQALAATTGAATQAREDVNRLFAGSGQAQQRGFGSALEFLGESLGQQVAPFQQGNVLAQQQISRGLPQIQNALLGIPTDLSGFQSRQVDQPQAFDVSRFLPQQPQQAQIPQQSAIQKAIEEAIASGKLDPGILSGATGRVTNNPRFGAFGRRGLVDDIGGII